MMEKIRQILLTEYIGAITIGFILAQAVMNFVNAFIQSATFYWAARSGSSSVFDTNRGFAWGPFAVPMISVTLYVTAAYLLLRWLYLDLKKTKVRAQVVSRQDAGR